MVLSNKITITVTEVILIQLSFLPLVLNKNNNNEVAESHDIFIPFKDVMRCAIWYHLYKLKNGKNTHGGALILVIF